MRPRRSANSRATDAGQVLGCSILRSGFVADGPIDCFGIEADQHLFADHQGRGRAALVLAHQLTHILPVLADVADFVLCASRREVRLDPGTGRSTGLRVKNDLLVRKHWSY